LEFVEATTGELAIFRHLLDFPKHDAGGAGSYAPNDLARLLVDVTGDTIRLSPRHGQVTFYAPGVLTRHLIGELGNRLQTEQWMLVQLMAYLEWIPAKMFAEACPVKF